ncbi:flagellar basal body rod protein FlgB [Marinobacteraceae bacterium S3BR75-40.1]
MTINFNNALGIHERALYMRTERAEVLANNLANADTPGFKARDIDFRAALDAAQRDQLPLESTNPGHMGLPGDGDVPNLKYRVPAQPSIDGNTVDTQVELAHYMRNSMDFQSTFQFLNGKFKGLTAAIKGE